MNEFKRIKLYKLSTFIYKYYTIKPKIKLKKVETQTRVN
jgi:hypothetical protein